MIRGVLAVVMSWLRMRPLKPGRMRVLHVRYLRRRA